MGAADIVPGISGGTIAFIMGFYQKLLSSITAFKMGKFCRSSAKFLSLLVCGIALAFILLVPIFDQILNHVTYRPLLYSGFFGLILGSIVLIFREINRWRVLDVTALVMGGILAFVLTGLDLKPVSTEAVFNVPVSITASESIINYNTKTGMLQNVPKSSVIVMVSKNIIAKDALLHVPMKKPVYAASLMTDSASSMHLDLWLIFCGAIAVSALLLPGISGSYLLTILGCYSIAIGAIADFIASTKQLTFDVQAFSILANIGLGILIGGILFSRVVLFLLAHYRNGTIALMTGFMIGALPVVWPFWSYHFFLNPLKLEKGILLAPNMPIVPEFGIPFVVCSLLATFGFCLVLFIDRRAKLKI